MSSMAKEVKVQVKSFLGSQRAYWHGNSLRVALPIALTQKLDLSRGKVLSRRNLPKFLFFETDKGILVRLVDQETEEKLKNLLGFIDFSQLSDEDLKLIFG